MKLFPNRALAIFLGALLIITGVITFLASNRSENIYPIGSAPAALQGFLKAMAERDPALARSYLEPESQCDLNDLTQAFLSTENTINLVEANEELTTARIEIEVKYNSNSLFNDGYSQREIIRLVKIEESWRITGIPWPLYGCKELNS